MDYNTIQQENEQTMAINKIDFSHTYNFGSKKQIQDNYSVLIYVVRR